MNRMFLSVIFIYGVMHGQKKKALLKAAHMFCNAVAVDRPI
jgi:hypothetical protein